MDPVPATPSAATLAPQSRARPRPAPGHRDPAPYHRRKSMYPSPRLAEARAEAFGIDERQSLISSYLIDIRGPGCPDFPAPVAIPVNKRSGIAMGNGKLLHLGESGAG